MGFGFFWIIFIIGFFVLFIYPAWRIASRAGFPGAIALLILIPGIGGLIFLAVLAFAQWPALEGRS